MKYPAFLLSALLLCGLTGCASGAAPSGSDTGSSAVTDAAESAAEETHRAESTDSGSSKPESQAADESAAESDTESAKKTGDSAQQPSGTSAADSPADTPSVSPADSPTDPPAPAQTDSPAEIGDALTIGIADTIHAAAGQQRVPVTVCVWNNTGFAMAGIRLYYDEPLHARELTDDHDAECEPGDTVSAFLTTCACNADKHLIVFAGFATEETTANGAVFTCYFDIPDDAESGTRITLRPEIADFADIAGDPLDVELREGVLVID